MRTTVEIDEKLLHEAIAATGTKKKRKLIELALQEVIRQRVYEGKKFREIAEALDCPLNTALARMHEGLKRLRLLWGDSHG